MKLLNYTTSYIAGILFIIVSIWAGIFYYAMLDEIYDSIDDGLDNQKLLIIEKAAKDSTVLYKNSFDESGYSITRIDNSPQKNTDLYIDTSMFMQNEKDFEPVRMLTTHFKNGHQQFELKVVTSMVEEDDLSRELLNAIIWLYLCIIVAIILLNNIVLKKIWSPFYALLSQLKTFRLDKQKPLLAPSSNVDEFQILNKTVEEMVQSNIDTYTNQKTFIENAAHELQTPLAITINKLETFSENNEVPDEQLRLITAAIENLVRLTRLNKAMLLLSRIENHQFHNPEQVNINQVVSQTLEAFKDQFEYKNIGLFYEEKGTCVAFMEPDLANSLILNLIKNALIYNIPEGYIRIIISKDLFQIENPGSRPLNANKIFKRFYKESPSSASTGLGLAIVKSITEHYHFGIHYEFQNGHIIKVNFKKE